MLRVAKNLTVASVVAVPASVLACGVDAENKCGCDADKQANDVENAELDDLDNEDMPMPEDMGGMPGQEQPDMAQIEEMMRLETNCTAFEVEEGMVAVQKELVLNEDGSVENGFKASGPQDMGPLAQMMGPGAQNSGPSPTDICFIKRGVCFATCGMTKGACEAQFEQCLAGECSKLTQKEDADGKIQIDEQQTGACVTEKKMPLIIGQMMGGERCGEFEAAQAAHCKAVPKAEEEAAFQKYVESFLKIYDSSKLVDEESGNAVVIDAEWMKKNVYASTSDKAAIVNSMVNSYHDAAVKEDRKSPVEIVEPKNLDLESMLGGMMGGQGQEQESAQGQHQHAQPQGSKRKVHKRKFKNEDEELDALDESTEEDREMTSDEELDDLDNSDDGEEEAHGHHHHGHGQCGSGQCGHAHHGHAHHDHDHEEGQCGAGQCGASQEAEAGKKCSSEVEGQCCGSCKDSVVDSSSQQEEESCGGCDSKECKCEDHEEEL